MATLAGRWRVSAGLQALLRSAGGVASGTRLKAGEDVGGPREGLQEQPLHPPSPAREEVRLFEAGQDPALLVRLGEGAVLGAGGVGGEGAGFEGAEGVLVAAGQDEDVLGSQVNVLGEDPPGRHVAEEQGAAGEGVAQQAGQAGASQREAVPADLFEIGQLAEDAFGQGNAGERLARGGLRRQGVDLRLEAVPEAGGDGHLRQVFEEGSAGGAELGRGGAAGGAAVQVAFDQHPVGQVGLPGSDGEQQLFGGVHGQGLSSQWLSSRVRRVLRPERMRDFRVPTGRSRRLAVSS